MNEERMINLINTNSSLRKLEKLEEFSRYLVYRDYINKKKEKDKLNRSLFMLVIAFIFLVLTVSKAMYMWGVLNDSNK